MEYPTAPDQTKLSDAANECLVKTYVKEAATNLYDLTPYFEVLNEVTGYSSFTEAEYATVLKWCREALDEAETEKELKIVLGGMIGDASLTWLEKVASELGSAGSYIDVISFHYYDGWPDLQTFIDNLKDTLVSTGLDDKPLWLTEAGLTPGPTPPGSIDEAAELQAHEMFQKFSIAFGNGVELANWHPLVSTCDPTDPPDPECTFGGYGLYQVGTGTATMAWDAYQLFATTLGNFITCTPVSEGPEIWAYRYAVPVFSFDSIYRNYWVIWADGSPTDSLSDIESALGDFDWVNVTSVASGFGFPRWDLRLASSVTFGTTPILIEDSRWHTSP